MSNEPTDGMHARFAEWLAQGAHGDPPRDAAVHAFVCPACQRQMAALDTLAEIDPGRATLPPSRPFVASRARSPLPALRVAAAAAGMLVLTLVISFGASRMLAFRSTSGDVATSSETPVQAVLGGEGSPGPRIGAIGGEAHGILPSSTPIPASEEPSPTAPPTAQANPAAATSRPVATQPPAPTVAPTRTAVATPTRRPTVSPSASASASVKPSASPTPSATPPPVPTPTATPTPAPATPEPTPTETPAGSAADPE